VAACLSGKSLNTWVAEQLQAAVAHLGTKATRKAGKPAKRLARRNGSDERRA
jgi:hypothetical protein